jgi:hypothetical protein
VLADITDLIPASPTKLGAVAAAFADIVVASTPIAVASSARAAAVAEKEDA